MIATPDTGICELPVAFSSLTVREVAYAKLQDEIAAAKEVLRACYQRYNDLSPISRLPPELLAGIFEHVRAVRARYISDVRWICRVSHICSRWRHVALDCPSLWSDIPFSHPAWAKEMLARSKMAALNVVFSSDGHYATWAQPRLAFIVKAAVLELSHIRNLHLSPRNLADVDYKEIIELLDAPAPFLETVEITDANLPVNLFAGDSPRLTGLVLSTCTFDMQLPIVANLRTLKLRHAPADNRIPVDQLISALSTMSRLEALHVIDSLDDHHGVTAIHPAQQVAQLPHLIELSIDCLLSNCISLLNRIVYPTSTRVCAKYQTDLSGKDDDISVVRSFAKELGSRAPGPIRSVMLDEHGIKVWQSPHAPASSPNLEITLPVLSKHEPAAKRFIRSLDLTRLKTLILHCPFSPKFLTTSFGELRHLTTVIAGDNAFMFLSALAVGLPRKTSSTTDGADADAGPSDKSKLTFLSFKTLQIEGWQFDELRQGGNTVFEVLKSCLRRRNEAGAPLPKLAIQSCLHGKEHLYVRALRAVVGEVEWDGASNQEDSDECEGCGHRR